MYIMALIGHFVSESGDRAVSEWLLTGTRKDGERVAVQGCDLFEFDHDGKMTVKDSYWKIVES